VCVGHLQIPERFFSPQEVVKFRGFSPTTCRGNKPSQGPTASPGLESQSRQMLASNRSRPYTTRLPLQEIAGKLAFPAPELEELKKISRPFGLQTGQQLINESLQRSQTSRLPTPKLKMSDRASTFFPSACYGDM